MQELRLLFLLLGLLPLFLMARGFAILVHGISLCCKYKNIIISPAFLV